MKHTKNPQLDYDIVENPTGEIQYEKIENALQKARKLQMPSREAMLHRSPEVQKFWDENKNLLVNAWEQWDEENKNNFLIPTDDLLDENLRIAINNAWEKPEIENKILDLFTQSSPGVYEFQLFDPNKLHIIRNYLEEVAESKIPLRPPYGILLNRRWAMLDKRSKGYIAAPSFQEFYQLLMDKYMRPISRLLFPEVVWYDTQTFWFSIQRQVDMDTSLRLHSDASSVTMNVNLNLPDEEFEGSQVDFHNSHTWKMNRLSFRPGLAIIHRGHIAHVAQAITKWKRTNFVFWLYWDGMSIPRYHGTNLDLSPQDRWNIPNTKSDNSAPF